MHVFVALLAMLCSFKNESRSTAVMGVNAEHAGHAGHHVRDLHAECAEHLGHNVHARVLCISQHAGNAGHGKCAMRDCAAL